MKLKNLADAAVAAVDKKLQRFDPKWQARNGAGGLRSRYQDKTGIARYREWRGVKDTFADYGAWLNNLMSMAAMVAKAPVPVLKGFWEYRWMGSYLGTFAFIDRLFEGYRGTELRIAHRNMHCIVASLTNKIALVLANDRRLGGGPLTDDIVPMDEVLPPLFMTGFPTLIPIPIQTLPEFIICDIDQHLEPHYIDVAESFGLAADVCSRCSAETGVAIDDDFPMVGKAVLTTNMPCNASEATSMFQRRRFGMPDFPVTLAMIHNEPGAHPYSTQMLKDAIAFIEKEYGVRYDWQALFARAEHMNEQNRIELEKWEIFKTPYSRPYRHIREPVPAVCLGLRQRTGGPLHPQRPQGAQDHAGGLSAAVPALSGYYPAPGLPVGPVGGVLYRLPHLDPELLGREHRAEHGLHHGPQHDLHHGPGAGHSGSGPVLGKGRHAPPRRGRVGQRQRRVGVGRPVQLRHGHFQRQRGLQGHERRPRADGGAGPRPGLPVRVPGA